MDASALALHAATGEGAQHWSHLNTATCCCPGCCPAGIIPALGQAMTVAAAALKRLVPQGPLDMQQLRKLLPLFNYVLALLDAWYACNNGVGGLCTSPPWPSTFPAFAALSAALLEATPVLSANPPVVAAELSPAGPRGGRGSSSHDCGGHSGAGPAAARTRVSGSIGMDESIEHWEEFEWCSICKRSVTIIAVAGGLLDAQLGLAVRFDRFNADLMDLLGSRDVLSLVVYEAAGIARDLHNAAGGKLPLPAPAPAPAGSSSPSRRSQVQQAVPASHDLLFEAIAGHSLLKCINLEGADKQWNPPPPALQRRVFGCVKVLRLLLLGQAADPHSDPQIFSDRIDMFLAAMSGRVPSWPPAATAPS